MGSMDTYDADFEAYLLAESAAYYQRKAAAWIQVLVWFIPKRHSATSPCCCVSTRRSDGAQEDSCPDYMLKAEECLKAEEERVALYLHASTKVKLLRAVETELLAKYETRLLEKEHSGAAALLRDDKARRPRWHAACLRHRPSEPAISPARVFWDVFATTYPCVPAPPAWTRARPSGPLAASSAARQAQSAPWAASDVMLSPLWRAPRRRPTWRACTACFCAS